MVASISSAWRNRPQAVVARLSALQQLGQWDDYLSLLFARPKISDWPDRVRATVYNAAVSGQLPSNRATHDYLWGPLRADLCTTILDTTDIPLSRAAIGGLAKTVERSSGRPIADRVDWEIRVRLGQALSAYYFVLRRMAKHPEMQLDAHIRPLTRRFSQVPEPVDLSCLSSRLASGQSVVVLQLHAGIGRTIRSLLLDSKLPLSLIGRGAPKAKTLDDLHVRTGQPDTVIQFARLCKQMRKSPRMVRILPDGGEGQGFAATEIGGVSIKIGLGAAHLAYLGKAAFVFAYSRWTDSGPTAEFVLGPSIDPQDTKEDAEAKLIAFYRESIIQILSGDPVNFGLRGGYWPVFLGDRK